MPGNLLFADSSFPVIREGEDTRAALKKVENYLYILLENLRYALQNLEPGNFNENELERYVKKLMADLVVADVVISNTIITNELYATYGSIADLTVDRLRTDYRRAKLYLAGDTSPIHYIKIQDEEIAFLSATTDGTRTEQLTVDGRAFWWTDNSREQMTAEKNTGIPVTVYVYQELQKRSIRFATDGATGQVIPVDTFGAGNAQGTNQGRIVKTTTGFEMSYLTKEGNQAGVYLREDGFADVTARRADIAINTAAKKITVSPEGMAVAPFAIGYVENGDRLTLTWPDGKSFTVSKT